MLITSSAALQKPAVVRSHGRPVLPFRAAPVTVPDAFQRRRRTCRGFSTSVVAAAAVKEEVALQFMVDMKCQGCVTAVRTSLKGSEGISSVDVDLDAQTVVVTGVLSVEDVQAALAASGRKARLIGQGGKANEFDDTLARNLGLDMRTLRQSLAGVVEYKGRDWGQGDVLGVVRFVQVTKSAVRVEASLSGLKPGVIHCLAIHTHGDLTRGVESVGPVFRPENSASEAGYVCSFLSDADGNASVKNGLLDSRVQVWDIVGRSLVVHSGDAPTPSSGIVAGVIARSAAVGDNDQKKICACDGTVIWDADGKITKRI